MNKHTVGDCPSLNMNPRSVSHENRFDVNTKRSENMKNGDKLQNSEKNKVIER